MTPQYLIIKRPEYSLDGPDDLIFRQGFWVSFNQVMYTCSIHMEYQYLTVYEVSGNQGRQVNRSRSYYSDSTGDFVHLVAEVFNVLSEFVREPHFLQGLEKCANGRRVDLLLIFYDGSEDLSTGGVIPKFF